MGKISRKWVALIILLLWQSSLGTSAIKLVSQSLWNDSAKNGYVKFSNGLLIQWGLNTSTAQYRTVYFPHSFSDASYSVVTTSQSSILNMVVTTFTTDTYTKSSFRAVGAYRGIDATQGFPAEPFRWIAIGQTKI